MKDLPIAVTVHPVDLLLKGEWPQQPVGGRHQSRLGHDQALELAGELGQAGLGLLLTGHHYSQPEVVINKRI